MKSVNRDDTDTTMYMGYADGYVRYSNDGIAYYNKKGTAIWNQTYTMQKPQVKICGSIIAVGDINGSKIYIFDKNGNIGIVDTSLAISQIEVAKQGVVAAVLRIMMQIISISIKLRNKNLYSKNITGRRWISS